MNVLSHQRDVLRADSEDGCTYIRIYAYMQMNSKKSENVERTSCLKTLSSKRFDSLYGFVYWCCLLVLFIAVVYCCCFVDVGPDVGGLASASQIQTP